MRRPLSPICPLIIGERLPPPTFWRRQCVQRALPWFGSIALHLAMILIGIMTYRADHPRIRGGTPLDGLITTERATANISTTATMQSTEAESPDRSLQLDRVFPTPHEPRAGEDFASALAPNTPVWPLPPTDEASNDAVMLGVGWALLVRAETGAGTDATATAAAGESSQRIAPTAAEARFFGVPGTGQAVIYVCDASGSMIGTNELIVSQLQRSLLAMHPAQVFNVIFFSGRTAPVVFDARDMIPADASNRLAACGFAKQYTCGGNSKGLPAITSALRRKPDLMYLVTDGDFDDSDQLVATIRAMNRDRFTRINVILVSGAAQHDPASYKFLKQIAEENGGMCHVIDPNAM